MIRDGNNHIIGNGQLGPGTGTERYETTYLGCIWKFTVKNVPETKFYSVTISHRGGLTYSLKQLQKMKWKINASLS